MIEKNVQGQLMHTATLFEVNVHGGQDLHPSTLVRSFIQSRTPDIVLQGTSNLSSSVAFYINSQHASSAPLRHPGTRSQAINEDDPSTTLSDKSSSVNCTYQGTRACAKRKVQLEVWDHFVDVGGQRGSA